MSKIKLFVLAALSVATLGACSVSIAFTRAPTPTPLDMALLWEGKHEHTDRRELRSFLGVDPVRVEWCAAFVNSVLDAAGVAHTDSLMARSYLGWGTAVKVRDLQPGDIMVFTRGRNDGVHGHVGFYVETVTVKRVRYWVVLGGNQDRSVSRRLYPANTPRLLGIRRARL